MFSSFIQYLCIAPSFTNVLNVYAFCNLHDVRPTSRYRVNCCIDSNLQVSWGTKGSDKAEALPSVSSSKSGDADTAVVEDKAQEQADVDAAFKETVTRAITKVTKKELPEKPTLDDENKTFRTRLVAVWMLSNAALAIAIENINGIPSNNAATDDAALQEKEHKYFTFILYSTFGLSLVRFIGVSPSVCSVSASRTNHGMAQCIYYLIKRNLFSFFRRN